MVTIGVHPPQHWSSASSSVAFVLLGIIIVKSYYWSQTGTWLMSSASQLNSPKLLHELKSQLMGKETWRNKSIFLLWRKESDWFILKNRNNFEMSIYKFYSIKTSIRITSVLILLNSFTGTYSVINIVVLLNLLIAMMNHSYQLISVS